MSSLDFDIYQIFPDATPEVDTSGALQTLFAACAAVHPVCAFAICDGGSVLTSPEAAPQAAAWLSSYAHELAADRTHPSDVRTASIDDRAAVIVTVADQRSHPVVLGLLFDGPEPPALPADLTAHLRATAPLAGLAINLANQLDLERYSHQQLLAEQETIRRAHEQTIAHVLEEREERLCEKRNHINLLESEVHRRSTALREALARAEQANRIKTEFVANMSHEIRTPMTAILGYSETLLDPSLSEDERTNAIQTILRNGRHLLDVINDILDISKIEAGKLVTERVCFNLVELIADVESMLRQRAESKGLTLRLRFASPLPDRVYSDPTRLRQILINLLGNAIKFTQRGSVSLSAEFVPGTNDGERPDELFFRISDTGIGMTPQQLACIFQPFVQADNSTTRQFGGTGLGLSISQRLANMLGGALTADSTYGVGSVFTLRIHIDAARDARMIHEPITPATRYHSELHTATVDLTGVRILLAEDGPDNQRLVSFVLTRAGAEVTVCANGQQALEKALTAQSEHAPFDVILMDMQMPVMDGYTATTHLREAGYARPIFALTAHAMEGERQRCIEAGCDECESKPIDRKRLIEKIHQWATKARSDAQPSDNQPADAAQN